MEYVQCTLHLSPNKAVCWLACVRDVSGNHNFVETPKDAVEVRGYLFYLPITVMYYEDECSEVLIEFHRPTERGVLKVWVHKALMVDVGK